jgi:hypothetical protein
MIISHSRRFIFVKCRKTASTSLEREIVPQLSSHDVWTPISSPRREGNNHYSAWPVDWLAARSKGFSDYIGRNSRLHWRFYHDHIAAAHIARLLPREQYDTYQSSASTGIRGISSSACIIKERRRADSQAISTASSTSFQSSRTGCCTRSTTSRLSIGSTATKTWTPP